MKMNKLEKVLCVGGLTSIAAGGVMALISALDISYSLSATALGLMATTIADNYRSERLQKLKAIETNSPNSQPYQTSQSQ